MLPLAERGLCFPSLCFLGLPQPFLTSPLFEEETEGASSVPSPPCSGIQYGKRQDTCLLPQAFLQWVMELHAFLWTKHYEWVSCNNLPKAPFSSSELAAQKLSIFFHFNRIKFLALPVWPPTLWAHAYVCLTLFLFWSDKLTWSISSSAGPHLSPPVFRRMPSGMAPSVPSPYSNL